LRSPDRLDDGGGDPPAEAVAEVPGTRSGFVAVVRERGGPRLVCGVYRRGLNGVNECGHDGLHDGVLWRVSSSPRRVLAVLRMADAAGPRAVARHSQPDESGSPGAEHIVTVRRVRGLLARVLTRRAALDLAGTSSGARHVPRVRRRLARLLERAPALARGALAERHEELMRALASPLEAARERRVDQLLRADLDDASFARRLGALLQDRTREGALAGCTGTARDGARAVARTAPLLILRRASAPTAARAPAPTAASPGTAAPR